MNRKNPISVETEGQAKDAFDARFRLQFPLPSVSSSEIPSTPPTDTEGLDYNQLWSLLHDYVDACKAYEPGRPSTDARISRTQHLLTEFIERSIAKAVTPPLPESNDGAGEPAGLSILRTDRDIQDRSAVPATPSAPSVPTVGGELRELRIELAKILGIVLYDGTDQPIAQAFNHELDGITALFATRQLSADEALDMAVTALEHSVPTDCYSTGPGNKYEGIKCIGCAALAALRTDKDREVAE